MNFARHATTLAATCYALFAMTGCSGPDRSGDHLHPPAAPGADCYISGISQRVRCLSMKVPVDWSRPGPDSITVSAVVLPANNRRDRSPLIVIPGGPGQGASLYGALVSTALADVRRTRDVVLFDPRGTGRSTPFDCRPTRDEEAGLDSAARVAFGQRCAKSAPAPTEFFTSREIIADLEALRQSLGAPRIVLWSGSFGTRLAQFYVAAHPAVVEAAVFDAAVPVDEPFVRAASRLANRSLAILRDRCHGAPPCAEAFAASLDSLDDWVDHFTAPRRFRTSDPLDGAPASQVLRRDDVLEWLRGALYVPQHAALLPLAVRELQRGNAAPLQALAVETAGLSTTTQQLGAMLGVMCSEEAPRVDPRQLQPRQPGVVFDETYARVFLDYCQQWPRRPLPAEMLHPPKVSVPALVLSGSTDPASPPAQGDLLAAHFVPASHVVIPNGGHINSRSPCMPQLIADFLDRPKAPVVASCIASYPSPPFALSPFGPVAGHD